MAIVLKYRKKETRAALHALLIKRFGRSKFKSSQEFIANAGLWVGLDVSAQELREKAWSRS